MSLLRSISELDRLREKIIFSNQEIEREVAVCNGSECNAWGGKALKEVLKKEIENAGLSSEVKIRSVGCLGICDRGPLFIIYPEGIFYQHVRQEDIPEIVEETIKKGNILARLLYTDVLSGRKIIYANKLPFWKEVAPGIIVAGRPIDPTSFEEYISEAGFKAFSKVLTIPKNDLFKDLRRLKIPSIRRGRISFVKEWRKLLKKGGVRRVYAVFGEEEVGLLKDRRILEGSPYAVLEGLLIAGHILNATKGVFLLRPELRPILKYLTKAIEEAKRYGLLGESILGSNFSFDIEVCDLLTYSWTDNNYYRDYIEMYAFLPMAFLSDKRELLKPIRERIPAVVLEGRINNSGLLRIKRTSTLREVIYNYGGGIPRGHRFKAALIGGYRGKIIKKAELDRTIEDIGKKKNMLAPTITLYDENSCMVDIALKAVSELSLESCGKCTPCRLGSREVQEILARSIKGNGTGEEVSSLETLSVLMNEGSKCAIGREISQPLIETISKFREEYIEHIEHRKCRAGVCQELISAPCKESCPLGIDIPEIMRHISKGEIEKAFFILREENPLPGICGRLCTHPCEARCMRERMEGALSIRNIGRYLSDHFKNSKIERFSFPKDKKVAIVGAGPSGLTCAYFLAKEGYPVEIFESYPEAGGQLVQAIPEFKIPREVIKRDIDALIKAGIEIHLNRPLNREFNVNTLKRKGFDAIYLAMGAQIPRNIGIPGEMEGIEGLYYGLSFLRMVKRKRGICVGNRVIVIGGGTVAMSVARVALRLGAREVKLYCRRMRDEMPSTYEEYTQAREEGVKFNFLVSPTRILHKDWKVIGIRLVRMKMGDIEQDGIRLPVPVEGSEFSEQADAVILAVGHRADISFLVPDSINIDGVWTNIPGVFAGGDFINGPGTVITAMKDGKQAAMAIREYLEKEERIFNEFVYKPSVKKYRGLPEKLKHLPKVSSSVISAIKRLSSFEEVEHTFRKEDVFYEAGRCLECDRYIW